MQKQAFTFGVVNSLLCVDHSMNIELCVIHQCNLYNGAIIKNLLWLMTNSMLFVGFYCCSDNLLIVHPSLVHLLEELTSVRVVMIGTSIFVLILKDDIGGVLYGFIFYFRWLWFVRFMVLLF
jgi:hypothetical protein